MKVPFLPVKTDKIRPQINLISGNNKNSLRNKNDPGGINFNVSA